MSYMYNASVDPSAMAFQSERNNLLNNPAYSVGNGQLGLGAYGTIGGVPIDMLNLPSGLGANSSNIDSVLQQFDSQNSGILQLGASLAGPNSQYSNLMQKYNTAVVVEQEKAKYQQQLQIQQMQLAQAQQQLAQAQQQQQLLQQQTLASRASSSGATSAAPAPAASGGGGANAGLGIALALLLMNGGITKKKSASNDNNVDDDDDGGDTTTPPANTSTPLTETEANDALRKLGFTPSEYTSIDSKRSAIDTKINQMLTDLQITDTDTVNGDVRDKLTAAETKVNGLLTRYGVTAADDASIPQKIASLGTTQRNQALSALTAIGVTAPADTESTINVLLTLNSTENNTKLTNLLTDLGLDTTGTINQKLTALSTKTGELNGMLTKVGNTTTVDVGAYSQKVALIKAAAPAIGTAWNYAISNTASYSDVVTKLTTIENEANVVASRLGDTTLVNNQNLTTKINGIKNNTTYTSRLNTYFEGLKLMTAGDLSAFLNQTNATTVLQSAVNGTALNWHQKGLILTDDDRNATIP